MIFFFKKALLPAAVRPDSGYTTTIIKDDSGNVLPPEVGFFFRSIEQFAIEALWINTIYSSCIDQ